MYLLLKTFAEHRVHEIALDNDSFGIWCNEEPNLRPLLPTFSLLKYLRERNIVDIMTFNLQCLETFEFSLQEL